MRTIGALQLENGLGYKYVNYIQTQLKPELISQDRAFGEIPVGNTVRDKCEDRFFKCCLGSFLSFTPFSLHSLAQLLLDENIYINEANPLIFFCSFLQKRIIEYFKSIRLKSVI